MSEVLKISEAVSLAIHAMMVLSKRDEGETLSVTHISEFLGVSRAHLAKVFQRLSKAGLVRSTRGPTGGFMLTRPAGSITLLEVFETIEGPLEETRCLLDKPVCEGDRCCMLGSLLHDVHKRVYEHMSKTTLDELCDKLKLDSGGKKSGSRQ